MMGLGWRETTALRIGGNSIYHHALFLVYVWLGLEMRLELYGWTQTAILKRVKRFFFIFIFFLSWVFIDWARLGLG